MEAAEELNKKPVDTEDDPFENILSYIGEMGRYQKVLFCAVLPFGFIFAFVSFVQMFIAASPQRHWCRVPELAHLDMELRRNLSAPGAIDGLEWDRCSTFNANWSQVLVTMRPPVNATTTPCQHGFDFEFTDIPYHTVTSEREWVCDKSSFAPIAQSIFFAGSFVGGVLFGWLADRFGRVPALVGANLIGFLGGVATIYTKGIIDYSIARFVVGMAYDSCFMIIYILVLEYIGPRYRTVAANMSMALFFGGGCLALPWLALGLADWRALLWLTSTPMLVVLVLPFAVPESVRWLISRGRTTEAVAIFRKFEKINGMQIPQEVMDDFLIASRRNQNQERVSVGALFRSAELRAVLLYMVVVYMSCAVIFDALVRLSESLGLDFFITFTLTSATEIPSVTILAMVLDKWGRRNLSVTTTAMAGMLTFIAIFVPKGAWQVSFAIMARFFMNMAYTTAVQWSTELLPTPVRASGSSLVHVSGYVATVMSPFIVYSERYWRPLPLLVMSITAAVAVGFGLLIPETMGRPMPQTIADGEALARNYTLCGKGEVSEDEVRAESKESPIS